MSGSAATLAWPAGRSVEYVRVRVRVAVAVAVAVMAAVVEVILMAFACPLSALLARGPICRLANQRPIRPRSSLH